MILLIFCWIHRNRNFFHSPGEGHKEVKRSLQGGERDFRMILVITMHTCIAALGQPLQFPPPHRDTDCNFGKELNHWRK